MESGERIGLIGRDGAGKSSLLGVIAGKSTLDDSEVRLREGTRVVLPEPDPITGGNRGSIRTWILLNVE